MVSTMAMGAGDNPTASVDHEQSRDKRRKRGDHHCNGQKGDVHTFVGQIGQVVVRGQHLNSVAHCWVSSSIITHLCWLAPTGTYRCSVWSGCGTTRTQSSSIEKEGAGRPSPWISFRTERVLGPPDPFLTKSAINIIVDKSR